MFSTVIDGNLVESPQPAKNEKYLRVKFCHNQREWTKDGIKESKVWVSGLIRPERIQSIRDRLVKGAYVIASTGSTAAALSQYNGAMQVNLNFIGQFDIGKSPVDLQKSQEAPQKQYTHGAIVNGEQQVQQQAQVTQQPQPSFVQQAQQYQQQPVPQYQPQVPQQAPQQEQGGYADTNYNLPY